MEKLEEELETINKEIDDFELTEALAKYEVWLTGLDKKDALVFEHLIDRGYDDLVESKKCWEYFLSSEHLKDFISSSDVKIPVKVDKLTVRLDMIVDDECSSIIEEQEVKIN